MSVSDVPFNWNAQLDIKKLRVGIIQESFDEITNASAKQNAENTLKTIKSLGVAQLIPVKVPEFGTNFSAINVEEGAFFDEHSRAGDMKTARGGGRPNGRLTTAVDYLQSQRARTMMMMKLADATAHVDVYIVGSNNTGVGGPGGGGRGRGAAGAPPPPERPQPPTQRHFAMANLAGYPAIILPNGFADTGSPTNAVIYGRPYGEMEVIALAKAYQDAAKFHLMKPTKLEGPKSSAV